MFTNIKKITQALFVLLFLATPVFAQNAKLDLVGTPMLLGVSGNSVTLGIETTGYIRLDTGTGSLQFPKSNPADGTAATTVAGSGTIDTTMAWQRVTDAGAITGVILEDGVVHGQVVRVTLDKDAVGSITMAAEATSNVCSGTGAVIAAGETAEFIYDKTDTCWSENSSG